MTSVLDIIRHKAHEALQYLFPASEIVLEQILINATKPEFEGDFTIVLFPLLKTLKQKPDTLGLTLGERLVHIDKMFIRHETVSGFLNMTISDHFWLDYLYHAFSSTLQPSLDTGKKIMIEYSSPNTNKPIHFGHLRNNFLGWSVAEILKQKGHQVIKANLINDRGIHICKSMIAWMKYGHDATPQSTGIKGDHFVGDYYVKFNDVYKEEIKALVEKGYTDEEAQKEAPLFKQAQELLVRWEAGDPQVYQLWQTMNGWVYEGFEITYQNLGIDFDKMYYESETYLLGKKIVEEGLQKGILFKKENGSVWIDLIAEKLDEKLLLRADGTSVYMTQDLGTAQLKYNDYSIDKSIYVIADEQNYHMQVLKQILYKLNEPCADGIYHLSYGMVELPSGRMKSREGTVVDADDMIAEMTRLAKEQTEQAGKTDGFSEEELTELYEIIGLGALKFYLLRVEPKKKMIFNPQESIELQGYTATFIQYAHARICSIIRKMDLSQEQIDQFEPNIDLRLEDLEKKIIILLAEYPIVLQQAAEEYNPSVICSYCFRLAQTFNSFYDKHSIANELNEEKKKLRITLANNTAKTIKHGMQLLGIKVPERM